MAHMQLSKTRIVQEAWQDLSEDENEAQTAAIYDVIGKHGGDVKVVALSPPIRSPPRSATGEALSRTPDCAG